MSQTSTPSGVDAQQRWGMVIDLNRCVGCQTCTVACKLQNSTPPGVQWRRVIDVEQGSFPDVERVFMVVGCQHCAEPPCVPVCPTGATQQRADGLVTMNYDRCIGCSYCAVACPYQARTIVHRQDWYYGVETQQEQSVAHPERLGVMTKCTFCQERVDDGIAAGLTPGVDPAATPACAAACISQAIKFGDFNDESSQVSQLASENKTFQMHAGLGTEPQIRYIYDHAMTPGRETAEREYDDIRLSQTGNPLAGERQQFWDWKAAANFMLGGASSGLALAAFAGWLAGGIPDQVLPLAYLLAAMIMAVGLTTLFFKTGRPLRAMNAILRPQSSWMSRELYAVLAFYPLVLAEVLPLLRDVGWQPNPVLHTLVALAALGFLIAQARMLYMAKGISAWRAPLIPWMVIISGIFEGIAILAVLWVLRPWSPAPDGMGGLAGAGLIFAIATFILWVSYRLKAQEAGIGPLSRRDLAAITPAVAGIGHIVPALLFTLLQLAPGLPQAPLFLAAGLTALSGGLLWKHQMITRICHHQGYELPKVPQRGSGRAAAPARLKAA
jgi:phenylacetyl-CoA:acceptor oxidoreductase subunit 1|tara:strand:- start:405 stop:2066 length:1662 start_codon:yes stop_codon:yes gene_type:complete